MGRKEKRKEEKRRENGAESRRLNSIRLVIEDEGVSPPPPRIASRLHGIPSVSPFFPPPVGITKKKRETRRRVNLYWLCVTLT